MCTSDVCNALQLLRQRELKNLKAKIKKKNEINLKIFSWRGFLQEIALLKCRFSQVNLLELHFVFHSKPV